MATIYLAGGCFWGLERFLSLVEGVQDTEVGYANGTPDATTYEEVCSGATGHAETVRVEYEPVVAPLPFLLEMYFSVIDPTSVNRQGNDRGPQYRTGIYYVDPADRPVIERALAELQRSYLQPIAIEYGPLLNFCPAEEYHQDYLVKHPGGYCHIDAAAFECARTARPEQRHFR